MSWLEEHKRKYLALMRRLMHQPKGGQQVPQRQTDKPMGRHSQEGLVLPSRMLPVPGVDEGDLAPADDGLELYVNYIIGYRSWIARQDPNTNEFLLCSLSRAYNFSGTWLSSGWPFVQPLVAKCRKENHFAPNVSCSCGIYAVKSGLTGRLTRFGAVYGQVALWGRVVEHELGYRAQFAYPISIELGMCSMPTCQKPADFAYIEELLWGTPQWWCSSHLNIPRHHGQIVSSGEVLASLRRGYNLEES